MTPVLIERGGLRAGAFVIAVLLLAGCAKPAAEEPVQAPLVSTLTVQAVPLASYEDLPGRVVPVRVAEIRPQVSGIVQKRLFEQGASVRAGQPLFQINAAPFRAEADVAQASLQRAEAALARAKLQTERLAPLVQADAISKQSYDDAVSQRDQAAAEVAQARATFARRQLDLKFATVEAPISGRVEQVLVTEGALVSPGDATPLTRIQQLDNVYVDVRRSAGSYEALRAALGGAKNDAGGNMPVQILRNDGKPYGVTGRILFSGTTVDTGTGDVLLRVLVDNNKSELLPGMFVHARVPLEQHDSALTLPQQAIIRVSGEPHAWVIDKNKKAQLVPLVLGGMSERRYHVRSGLAAGQLVVVEGMERLSDGATVSVREWKPASTASAAALSASR